MQCYSVWAWPNPSGKPIYQVTGPWMFQNNKKNWKDQGISLHCLYILYIICILFKYIYKIYIYIWAPAKTPNILEQLHQDIDTWYYHETLRNDRGDTKNDDFWYTCLPDFIANIKSSGTMRDIQTHKKRWPFQPRPFADVIGLVLCSYVYLNVCIYCCIFIYI